MTKILPEAGRSVISFLILFISFLLRRNIVSCKMYRCFNAKRIWPVMSKEKAIRKGRQVRRKIRKDQSAKINICALSVL